MSHWYTRPTLTTRFWNFCHYISVRRYISQVQIRYYDYERYDISTSDFFLVVAFSNTWKFILKTPFVNVWRWFTAIASQEPMWKTSSSSCLPKASPRQLHQWNIWRQQTLSLTDGHCLWCPLVRSGLAKSQNMTRCFSMTWLVTDLKRTVLSCLNLSLTCCNELTWH